VQGGAVVRSTGEEIELLWLAVASGARRLGLASELVLAVLDWAAEGNASVRLEVRESNAAAQGLYRRHGFVVAGRRPRYYRDGEDAVLLESPRHREEAP